MPLKLRYPAWLRSMAGQIFILLAVGIAASSIISLYFANQARRDDFQRIRYERVVASAVDLAGRLEREPERTTKMLDDRLILGAASAPVGVSIGNPEQGLARELERHLGPTSHPEAGQVPTGLCFRAKKLDPRQAAAGYADAPRPDCWIVRFTDSAGQRQAIALGLPRLTMPPDATFSPLDLLFIMLVSGLLAILVAREIARPLRRLEKAAEDFSLSLDPRPLPEKGPNEVRAALSTFNLMQNRVRAGFRERTQLLAAISHDLQTPLTRMRLRLEQVENAGLREKLLQDHHAMLALVREGLDLASLTEVHEDWAMIDIDSMLTSLAEDATELGHKVRFSHGCGGMVRVKPNALTRCVGNLVDNAVKYGGDADIRCQRRDGRILISVRDHGPGIDEADLDEMFEPFTRGVAGQPGGRSGTGIGLTIARSLAMTFDGAVRLANAPDGGLIATVSFEG
ncbi:MAG: ATP-binding protein [Sphingobium sp.]